MKRRPASPVTREMPIKPTARGHPTPTRAAAVHTRDTTGVGEASEDWLPGAAPGGADGAAAAGGCTGGCGRLRGGCGGLYGEAEGVAVAQPCECASCRGPVRWERVSVMSLWPRL